MIYFSFVFGGFIFWGFIHQLIMGIGLNESLGEYGKYKSW